MLACGPTLLQGDYGCAEIIFDRCLIGCWWERQFATDPLAPGLKQESVLPPLRSPCSSLTV